MYVSIAYISILNWIYPNKDKLFTSLPPWMIKAQELKVVEQFLNIESLHFEKYSLITAALCAYNLSIACDIYLNPKGKFLLME